MSSRTPSRSTTRKRSGIPTRSAAITFPAQYPICASELAAPRSPSGRNQAFDAVLVAEAADRGDALLTREAQAQCLFVAEPAAQLGERAPPAVDEPAVASARTAATDVLFQQDDVEFGLRLLQEPGGPHAGVPARPGRRRPPSCRGRVAVRDRRGRRRAHRAATSCALRRRGSAWGSSRRQDIGRPLRPDHGSHRLVRCVPSPARSRRPRHGRRPTPQLGGHRRTPTCAGPRHVARRRVLRR